MRAALLVLAVVLLSLPLSRAPSSVGSVMAGGLLALAAGALAGLLAALTPSRPLAVLVLLLLVPLRFYADVTFAIGRLELVAPWIGGLFVWASALTLAAVVVLASSLLLPIRTMSRPMRRLMPLLLAAGCVAIALEPLQRLREWFLDYGPYATLCAGLLAIAYARPYRLLLLPPLLGAAFALTRVPERYEELQLTALGTLLGSAALLVRADFTGSSERPSAKGWLVVLAATAAALSGAQLIMTNMAPRERAALSRQTAVGVLVRAGQRASDFDGDGYGTTLGQRDCAPRDELAHPAGHEIAGNLRDENCMRGAAKIIDGWSAAHEALHARPVAARPDIVLVVIDTLRYDSALDEQLAFFAALRSEGVWFERAYSSSSFTSQALLGLLAAKIPSAVPMRYRGKLYGVPTGPVGGLAPWLRRAGYDTGFAGGATASENEYFLDSTFVDGIRVKRALSMNAAPAQLREAAVAAFQALDPAAPRFLYVHAMWVHRQQASFDDYTRSVRELDAELLALRQTLGHDALWIVTADHGEEFHEHGARHHATTLFDEVMHVPLVLSGPGLTPHRVASVTATRALFPTLGAMVSPERAPSGLGPYLCLVQAASCRDMPVPMALELPGLHLHGLLMGRHKIVRDLIEGRLEAYDLLHDPRELAPMTPDQALRDSFEAWEEHAFGIGERHAVWPYVAAP